MEKQLDTLLNRRGAEAGSDPVFQQPSLRALLEAYPQTHHLFIVLGSPVTEVGRDHDYDWAVVEPSSMRSLIQLAGRVRRHRAGEVAGVNIAVLDSNLRHFECPEKPAFCKPGFEMSQPPFQLKTHCMQDLIARELGTSASWAVDAQPRIALPASLYPGSYLVDLEHARLHNSLLSSKALVKDDASLWWREPEGQTPRALWLTGLLPQYQRFRYDTQPRTDVALLPDEEEETLRLHHVIDAPAGQRGRLYMPVGKGKLDPIPQQALDSPSVSPWLQVDLLAEITRLSQAKDMSLTACAQRFATASLPRSENGWMFHPALGFLPRT